jgi:hypothetical protein
MYDIPSAKIGDIENEIPLSFPGEEKHDKFSPSQNLIT